MTKVFGHKKECIMRNYALTAIMSFLCLFASPSNSEIIDPEKIQLVVPSDDGQRLLLSIRTPSKKDYRYQLFLTSSQTSVIPLPIISSRPIIAVWGPTPTHITFLENSDGKTKIIEYSLKTKKRIQRGMLQGEVITMHYSPQFKKIALVAAVAQKKSVYYFEGEQRPQQHLWIFDRAAKKFTRRGTTLGSIDGQLQWFNDEKRILVTHRPSLEYFDSWIANIAIINTDTDSVHNIATGTRRNENALLSTNEKLISFITNNVDNIDERPDVFQFSRIALYNVVDGKTTLLKETPDAAPQLHAFLRSSDDVLISEANHGNVGFSVFGKQTRLLDAQPGIVRTTAVSHNKQFIGYVEEGPLRAPRPCLRSLTDAKEKCFNLFSPPRDVSAIREETISYDSFDGTKIEGMLFRPKGRENPLPAIIVVHGGPTYHSFREYVAHPHSLGTPFVVADLVAKGFLVFLPNIRGSIGYGPQFRKANHGEIGGADYQDVIAAANYLVRNNLADKDKLGIFGWSYGGFMCELSATQSTIFKAAVCGAAISNWLSHDNTSDFKSYTSGYFSSRYTRELTRSMLLAERSPALSITNGSTPMLIMHGTADRAVDFGQALEMFWSLKKKNATVKLAAFPEQGHIFSSQEAMQQAAILVEEWFVSHLTPATAADTDGK